MKRVVKPRRPQGAARQHGLPALAPHRRARESVRDLQDGAVADLDLPCDEVAPGRALRGQVAALFTLVGEGAVDRQLEAGDRAGAAGDLRDRRDRVQAEVATVDVGDPGGGDDRGRSRHVDVGVDEEQRGVAVDAAVEEEDRALGVDRRLFGEGDLDLALSGAADCVGGGLLHRRRREARAPGPARPRGFPLVVCSKSAIPLSAAGGWLPSTAPIRALRWAAIGTRSCRGSFDGEIPPLSRRKRFPTRTTSGFARALAATISARPAAMATARIRCLLMLVPLPRRWNRGDHLPGMLPSPPQSGVSLSGDSANREKRTADYSSSCNAVSISVAKSLSRRPKRSSTARRRLVTVRRSTPSTAAVEERLRSAAN